LRFDLVACFPQGDNLWTLGISAFADFLPDGFADFVAAGLKLRSRAFNLALLLIQVNDGRQIVVAAPTVESRLHLVKILSNGFQIQHAIASPFLRSLSGRGILRLA